MDDSECADKQNPPKKLFIAKKNPSALVCNDTQISYEIDTSDMSTDESDLETNVKTKRLDEKSNSLVENNNLKNIINDEKPIQKVVDKLQADSSSDQPTGEKSSNKQVLSQTDRIVSKPAVNIRVNRTQQMQVSSKTVLKKCLKCNYSRRNIICLELDLCYIIFMHSIVGFNYILFVHSYNLILILRTRG